MSANQTNTPETLQQVVQEYTELREYRDVDFDELVAALSAMVAEIIGEDTSERFDPGGMADYGEQQKNALRMRQRQRAAALGFTVNKEGE